MKNIQTILERINSLDSKLSNISSAVGVTTNEIIDRRELCKRLDVTEPTLCKWEKELKIPSFRIGNSIRYDWGEVVIYLKKQPHVA
jgi:hypothetical protein